MADNNKPIYLQQFSDESKLPFNVADEPAIALPDALKEKIDHWIRRYPKAHKRSGVYEALRLVQEQQGSLTVPWMKGIADHLGMPYIAVYEIASFYTMFHLSPVGKHVIDVCTNISCALNGSDDIMAHLKKRLGIELNETTADGRFTLKEVECLGACIGAPACMIGKHYHERLTPEKIDEILAQLT